MPSVYKRTGSPFYQAKIQVGGKTLRFSTGERVKSKAREAAERREEQENLVKDNPTGLSLVEAAAALFDRKDRPLRPHTKACYMSSLTNLCEVLGDDVLMISIRLDSLRRFIAERTKTGVGEVSIKRDLAFLSSCFTSALKADPSLPDNPVRRLPKRDFFKPERRRERWVTMREFESLLAACATDTHRLILRLLVESGMRSGEVKNLRWGQIDWKNRRLTVGNLNASETKTGVGRDVPLTRSTLALLRLHKVTLAGHTTDWVFPGRDGTKPVTTFKTFWQGVTKRAGVNGLKIHDLRHTSTTWLNQLGVTQRVRQDLLGHKSAAMTSHYTHSEWSDKRKAIDMLEDTLQYTKPSDEKSSEGRGTRKSQRKQAVKELGA